LKSPHPEELFVEMTLTLTCTHYTAYINRQIDYLIRHECVLKNKLKEAV